MKTEEDEIYEAFEHANRVKFGTVTGKKIIAAVKANNVVEVKRLLSLPVDIGGLLLLRLTEKDENGKTAKQIAEEMNNLDMLEIFK